MNKYTLVAPCFFGVEKMLSREITNLGYEIEKVEDGRVTFSTDEYGISKSNMWLRCAERILLKVGEFEATTFDDLFENTKRIDWSKFIPYDGEFPVHKATSIKSKLFSTPDIQAIVKKAVVESMKKKYDENWFLENKEKYPIYVFLNKDKVTLCIDTSGEALHKRGYREKSNQAPIRETLAASLVYLTPWRPGRPLIDPLCGSGTILIEAAMIGLNMAPGLNREFISEKWRSIDKKIWPSVRKEARDAVKSEKFKIKGYDIDSESIEIAKENAKLANVSQYIDFEVQDVKDLKIDDEYGFLITNPPYGERLEDKESVKALYKEMGKVFKKLNTWSYYIITSHEKFEYEFGKKSDRNRKLYNGMLKAYYYQYMGPKPPKNNN
jgi:putative N6-adenine-specific DNA methylase